MGEIIEGRWENLVGRQDLRGRKVRIIVLEEGDKGVDDPWLKFFYAWVESHEPVGHWVDDSRESIYSATMDDPR